MNTPDNLVLPKKYGEKLPLNNLHVVLPYKEQVKKLLEAAAEQNIQLIEYWLRTMHQRPDRDGVPYYMFEDSNIRIPAEPGKKTAFGGLDSWIYSSIGASIAFEATLKHPNPKIMQHHWSCRDVFHHVDPDGNVLKNNQRCSTYTRFTMIELAMIMESPPLLNFLLINGLEPRLDDDMDCILKMMTPVSKLLSNIGTKLHFEDHLGCLQVLINHGLDINQPRNWPSKSIIVPNAVEILDWVRPYHEFSTPLHKLILLAPAQLGEKITAFCAAGADLMTPSDHLLSPIDMVHQILEDIFIVSRSPTPPDRNSLALQTALINVEPLMMEAKTAMENWLLDRSRKLHSKANRL